MHAVAEKLMLLKIYNIRLIQCNYCMVSNHENKTYK